LSEIERTSFHFLGWNDLVHKPDPQRFRCV
jgi:hypothetical protein